MITGLETDQPSVAMSRRAHTRRPILAAITVVMLGLSACSGSSDNPVDTDPGDTSVDDPIFDPSVDEGVNTETDEGRNSGFEADEPSGNVTNVND